jgi:CRP-like cAMP-binding protein
MTDHAALVEILMKIPGLTGYPAWQLQVLADLTTMQNLTEDQLVYCEDAQEQDIYFLLSGLVETRMRLPAADGAEATIRTIRPGEFFGETAFFDHGRRMSSAIAREHSLVIRFDATALEVACTDDPSLGLVLYRTLGRIMAARYRDTSIELRNMLRGGF